MTRRNPALWALSLISSALLLWSAAPSPAAPKYESGGAKLLTEGLDELLGPAPADHQQRTKPTNQEPAGPPPSWAPDQRLLNDLIENNLNGGAAAPIVGEDVGQARENPLQRIEQNMGHASQMIGRIDNQAAGVQQQIVSDLDKLIAEMEKQCNGGGQCDNPSQSQKQGSKRSQPKQAQSKSEAKPKPGEGKPGKPGQSQAQNAAGDSTLRLGAADAASVEGRPTKELMKEVWGHLPARLREQMLQGASDEFLPEYREEIERYFQRLAEEEARADGR